MFSLNLDDRLSGWASSRVKFAASDTPLQDIAEYWNAAPFTPYNKNIDPYNQKSWPTPWAIISDNVYDDFTKALMISYTIKLLPAYANTNVEIQILTNSEKNKLYNIVIVDKTHVINYVNEVIEIENLNDNLFIDTIITVQKPR